MGYRRPPQCSGRAGSNRIKPTKVIIVGARTARQGTGPFIAGAFGKLGANVSAIVGTQSATVGEAQLALEADQGIRCIGYINLRKAMEIEKPNVVALCSPYQFHTEQLMAIAAANCHCLVEKPLAWPANDQQVMTVLQAFESRGLLLEMVSQWPQTLTGFTQIHGPIPETISDFAMRLSPISIGSDMVPDSAPHFISMLHALCGPGDFRDIKVQLQASCEDRLDRMLLDCTYKHHGGTVQAQLRLETCESRPRPAWYQINDLRVDRQVQLPEYQQQLVSDEKSATLQDPLESVVEQFLNNLHNAGQTDVSVLRLGQRNLEQLAHAWPQP
ncbi:MAG: putative dehydrogenase [Halioglobus sp.]